jgi:mono/diheme cytochrome c family protein
VHLSNFQFSWALNDGVDVTIRPIRPDVAVIEQEFVRLLSPQSKFLRFFAPIKELSPSALKNFTQTDYLNDMALIATIVHYGVELEILGRIAMKKFMILALLVACTAGGSGCDRDPMSEVGFRLPDGDPVAGREAFLYMQCNQCHTIAGEYLPTIPLADPPYVELGGPVAKVKTYGELVTAIINPSHKLANGYAEDLVSEDGESKMYVYNGYMTVQELIDIVMFLQPYYDVVVPEFQYRVYP